MWDISKTDLQVKFLRKLIMLKTNFANFRGSEETQSLETVRFDFGFWFCKGGSRGKLVHFKHIQKINETAHLGQKVVQQQKP